ncbi:HAMP domain-containing histidine kinase [Jeotgalibacillus sp. S-D1]|uniref:sensor histidine kinase n=1 Tax=Jeotgalibacillus sp. S-D1 TaxID=2552189 RepID=UPI001059F987|nr:sensor histidine kinase [Jeotgalibacillus sp. S-D1]TDL31303.1 HAMP domain-containing histidine kinase [Jeotgalibacillus sp. S-D1]
MMGYIKERRSWIAAFFVFMLLANILFWLDGGLTLAEEPVVYFNGLFTFLFFFFFIWRYKRETVYLREIQLMAEEPFTAWEEVLPEAHSPHQEIMNNTILQAIDSSREAAADLQKRYVLKTSDIESWVHEMKTPLTAMKLQLEPYTDDVRFQKLEREWTRLYFLLEQQLYLSRLPSIEHDTVMEKTTIRNLIYPEIKSFLSICRERGIGFEIEGQDLEVTTDVKWGRFIFRQLLSNAIKYSPNDVEVYIKAGHDGQGLALEVTDTGCGIDAHDLPRVFEKGYTGQAGRLQQAATGLGLYLAKSASEQLQITLTLDSDPGSGTTARIRFSQPGTYQAPLHSI